MAKFFCVLCVLCGFHVVLAADRPVSGIAQAVDRHYNHLTSLQADFTESYQGAGISRRESGMLWLKRPGKMLWQYRFPREKIFVIEGKTAYFYAVGESQARKAPVNKLHDLRSPLRYLLGKTRLAKELERLSLAPEISPAAPANIVLEGIPRGMGERVTRVLLEINPANQIVRIVAQEIDGSSTEFAFSRLLENGAIPDTRFRFRPPAGVEIIETTGLAP